MDADTSEDIDTSEDRDTNMDTDTASLGADTVVDTTTDTFNKRKRRDRKTKPAKETVGNTKNCPIQTRIEMLLL